MLDLITPPAGKQLHSSSEESAVNSLIKHARCTHTNTTSLTLYLLLSESTHGNTWNKNSVLLNMIIFSHQSKIAKIVYRTQSKIADCRGMQFHDNFGLNPKPSEKSSITFFFCWLCCLVA